MVVHEEVQEEVVFEVQHCGEELHRSVTKGKSARLVIAQICPETDEFQASPDGQELPKESGVNRISVFCSAS